MRSTHLPRKALGLLAVLPLALAVGAPTAAAPSVKPSTSSSTSAGK